MLLLFLEMIARLCAYDTYQRGMNDRQINIQNTKINIELKKNIRKIIQFINIVFKFSENFTRAQSLASSTIFASIRN